MRVPFARHSREAAFLADFEALCPVRLYRATSRGLLEGHAPNLGLFLACPTQL